MVNSMAKISNKRFQNILSWMWLFVGLILLLFSAIFHWLDHNLFTNAGYGFNPTNRVAIAVGCYLILFIFPYLIKSVKSSAPLQFEEIPYKIVYYIMPKNRHKNLNILISLLFIIGGIVSLLRGIFGVYM